MRIYSMTATFGKLEHETLTLQPGLNIIHAPNEWGKSTWCAFLVSMLYGIETRARSTKTDLADKNRYAPWSGAPMAGSMDICWQGRDITIERRTKGRTVFGEFHAFETATGLPVEELTADNCGQQLLGVERSVFTRAGFLKLTDLPVTEDESLRRRLNALVTTGDESGASDTLAQKLKDLKNRCRFNRSGLLPQAESQRDALQNKLAEMTSLDVQLQQVEQRQKELQAYSEQLKNHKTALEYAAARAYGQRLAAAQARLELQTDRVQQLKVMCDRLPMADQLDKQLGLLQQLREEKESLQTQAQMLPQPPEKPIIPDPFRGCTPEQALQQAQADEALYAQLQADVPKNPVVLWLCGLVGVLAGGVLLALQWMIPGVALLLLGAAGLVTGFVRHTAGKNRLLRQQNQQALLIERYRPCQPAQWTAMARRYCAEQTVYEQKMQVYTESLQRLETAMAENQGRIKALTGGESVAQCEHSWKEALQIHKTLADALRERQQAEEVVQTLSSANPQAEQPAMPDEMTLSAEETDRALADCAGQLHLLQNRVGQLQGQMTALGDRALLEKELQQVKQRIAALEETYGALELAQKTLNAASQELQRRFAPRISQRAQELFRRLTGSRYDRLRLGEDLSVSAGAEGEDTLRAALWRSDGTVDQLYLALRLAVAEELTPEAPLILDDALVRFDDVRLAAAMEILNEEAAQKQVILFTCQGREIMLKKEKQS